MRKISLHYPPSSQQTEADLPSMYKNVRLSTAVHAVNVTIGPDGLTLSLLLFGATPRLPIPNVSSMASTEMQRFEAMRAARQEMENVQHRDVSQQLQNTELVLLLTLSTNLVTKFEFGEKHRRNMRDHILSVAMTTGKTYVSTSGTELFPSQYLLLKELSGRKQHTTIDTSGYCH